MPKRKSPVPFSVENMFEEFGPNYDEQNAMGNLFSAMANASSHQLSAAVELTKLIHSGHANELSADKIMQTFKQVLSTVNEASPFQKLLEQIDN